MKTVKDVMKSNVICLDASWPLAQAQFFLNDKVISGAPVVENGRVIGVASLTNFSAYLSSTGADPSKARVGDCMMPFNFCVTPEDTVADMMKKMIEARIHRVIVTDTEQRPVGIVTSLDLLEIYQKRLDQP